MTTCFHCNQEHPDGHYERVVYNQTPLYGPWAGWRMAGRYLVAPGGQQISLPRMKGLLWRDDLELRRAGFQSRKKAEKGVRPGAKVKVIVVDLADWQAQHFGRAAG
jgi:hypothetical protein